MRILLLNKTRYSFDTRGIFVRCSQTTENNNWQSDKKEILTNSQDQDKKYNSMKHLKGQQFLFTKTCIESEVSLKILSHE